MSRIFSASVLPGRVAMGLENGRVEVRCARTRQLLFHHADAHGPESETLRTAFDAELLATGGGDGNVCLFTPELELRAKLQYHARDEDDRAVYALWFGQYGLWAGYEDCVEEWDLVTQQSTCKFRFDALDGLVTVRNPSGKQLVFDACSSNSAGGVLVALASGSIAVLDPRTSSQQVAAIPNAHNAAVTCVCVDTVNTHRFASTSVDGRVKVWDDRTLKAVFASPALPKVVYGAQFVPGEEVMTWSGDSLRYYDLDGGGVRRVRLGFSVLCAQQLHGQLVACGAPRTQPPTKHCCDNDDKDVGGMHFAKLD